MENIVWTIAPIPFVLGVIIKMLIGGIWYAPILFGKQWMKLTGFRIEDMQTESFKQAAKIGYTGALITAITTSYIIGVLIQSLKIEHLGASLGIMLLLFIGFSFPVLLSRHLWENRPWGLLPIDAGYEWFSYTLIGLLYIWL